MVGDPEQGGRAPVGCANVELFFFRKIIKK
jgi:hypothetical protein